MPQSDFPTFTAALRDLLITALSDQDLDTLCYDYFRAVYNDFAAEHTKGARIHRLIEYCERQRIFPQLLTQLRRLNPARYEQFTTVLSHQAVSLPPDRILQVNTTLQALQADYRQSLTVAVGPTAFVDDLQFRDREDLRARILHSRANHIELYGPAGSGKTYLFKHITRVPGFENVRSTYIDLAEDTWSVADIVPEVIAQLSGRPLVPSHDFSQLAQIIHDLNHGAPAITQVVFMFDSAAEAHRPFLDWLLSDAGLISNTELMGALALRQVQGVKLQVIIATRRRMLQTENYHANLFFEHVPIEPLEQQPSHPVEGMLTELADRRPFALQFEVSRQLSEKIYYLTGGHPKCARQLAFAVARADFRPTEHDWQVLFTTEVLPVISREMLASPAVNPDLLPTLWTLSVFRRFDQHLLATLLKDGVLPNNFVPEEIEDQARRLRLELAATGLVDEPGVGETMYTLNVAVRRVLSLSMQFNKPERYRAVNSASLKIYTDWLQSGQLAPDRTARIPIEIVYHWLKALETDPTVNRAVIGEQVCTALRNYWPLWLANLDDTYLRQMRDYWRTDKELRDTATRSTGDQHCFGALSHEVETFVANALTAQPIASPAGSSTP